MNDPSGTPANRKVTIASLFGLLYPVGSIYISTLSTNPGTLLGVGTWSAFGAGRTLVSLDSGQTEFDTVEETGGAKTHTLLEAELPAHSHSISVRHVDTTTTTGSAKRLNNVQESTGGAGGTLTGTNTDTTGSGTAHNNLQPYIVVYIWKRTA